MSLVLPFAPKLRVRAASTFSLHKNLGSTNESSEGLGRERPVRRKGERSANPPTGMTEENEKLTDSVTSFRPVMGFVMLDRRLNLADVHARQKREDKGLDERNEEAEGEEGNRQDEG